MDDDLGGRNDEDGRSLVSNCNTYSGEAQLSPKRTPIFEWVRFKNGSVKPTNGYSLFPKSPDSGELLDPYICRFKPSTQGSDWMVGPVKIVDGRFPDTATLKVANVDNSGLIDISTGNYEVLAVQHGKADWKLVTNGALPVGVMPIKTTGMRNIFIGKHQDVGIGKVFVQNKRYKFYSPVTGETMETDFEMLCAV